jgi:hypothetical protein
VALGRHVVLEPVWPVVADDHLHGSAVCADHDALYLQDG